MSSIKAHFYGVFRESRRFGAGKINAKVAICFINFRGMLLIRIVNFSVTASRVMNYLDPGILSGLTVDPSARREIKWTLPYSVIAPIAMAGDAIVIFIMSVATGVGYHLYAFGEPGSVLVFSGQGAIVAVLFVALEKSNNLYDVPALLNFKSQIRLVTLKWVVVFLFLSAITFMTKIGGSFSRGAIVSFALAGLAALIGTRIGLENCSG